MSKHPRRGNQPNKKKTSYVPTFRVQPAQAERALHQLVQGRLGFRTEQRLLMQLVSANTETMRNMNALRVNQEVIASPFVFFGLAEHTHARQQPNRIEHQRTPSVLTWRPDHGRHSCRGSRRQRTAP